jgi:2'-5' RNA ligase
MDPFTIELAGCGHFPPRGEPRIVWIGIDEREQLAELHRKIVRKLDVIGIEVERRRFAPHITIARLKRTRSRDVGEFVARHALLRSAPIAIQHFTLFSSVLSRSGSQYRRERIYPLGA